MSKHFSLFILGSLLLCLLLSACHKKSIVLEGTLENGAGKTVNITETTPRDGEKDISTVTLDSKGHFSFKHKMEYQTFYNLHVNQSDYVMLLPRQGETVQVTGNYNDLTHTYEVKGSPESLLLWQLQDYSNQGSEALTALVRQDHQNQSSLSEAAYKLAKAKTDSIFVDLYSQQAKYMSNFIHDNVGSLSTLIALYKPFNNHPLLPPQSSVELYEVVLQGLEKKQPDNPHTINFKNTVEEVKYKYGSEEPGMTMQLQAQ